MERGLVDVSVRGKRRIGRVELQASYTLVGNMDAAARLDLRLAEFHAARDRLSEAIDEWHDDPRVIIRDSVVKRFEMTFELAWKATGAWLRVWEKDLSPGGPRQTLESGFDRGVIHDANQWSTMLLYRNQTVHVYSEVDADTIAQWVAGNALESFDALLARLTAGE